MTGKKKRAKKRARPRKTTATEEPKPQGKMYSAEVEEELRIGREIMKQYREVFEALAKM